MFSIFNDLFVFLDQPITCLFGTTQKPQSILNNKCNYVMGGLFAYLAIYRSSAALCCQFLEICFSLLLFAEIERTHLYFFFHQLFHFIFCACRSVSFFHSFRLKLICLFSFGRNLFRVISRSISYYNNLSYTLQCVDMLQACFYGLISPA